jgi:hypothetical protein
MAAYESGHKADRIRRANRQKAERGDWHGAPKFGYGHGGVLIPEEAVVIREMADRFLAGQSLRSITKWLNEESGVPSPRAGKGTLGVWHATTVKSISRAGVLRGGRRAMGRIVAARTRLEDLAHDYGAGVLSRAEFHAARAAAQGAIHDAERTLRMRPASMPPRRSSLAAPTLMVPSTPGQSAALHTGSWASEIPCGTRGNPT